MTPWMDRLAAGGVRFTNAYAHNVVTLPSHANILSGRLPPDHGVRDNSGFRFPAAVDTLATIPGAAPFLATKVWTTGKQAGIQEMERSLHRMRTKRMDLMQVHNLLDVDTHLPTLRDWSDHMTTAFPEVRMKKFLEMRGADGGPWARLCALPAFWVGLLYDDAALDAAWDLVRDFSTAERHALRDGVPKHALKLPFRGATVR